MPNISVRSDIKHSKVIFVDHELRFGYCDGFGSTSERSRSGGQAHFNQHHAICQTGNLHFDFVVDSDVHQRSLYHAASYSG